MPVIVADAIQKFWQHVGSLVSGRMWPRISCTSGRNFKHWSTGRYFNLMGMVSICKSPVRVWTSVCNQALKCKTLGGVVIKANIIKEVYSKAFNRADDHYPA